MFSINKTRNKIETDLIMPDFKPFIPIPDKQDIKEIKSLIDMHIRLYNNDCLKSSIDVLLTAKNRIEDYIVELNK